jgi:hypothetical protein
MYSIREQRRNLVISPVGDSSWHKYWIKDKNKEFDLMLIYFGPTQDKYKEDADYYLQTSGMFKLENIATAVNKYYDIIKSYEAVFLPDDDMLISTSSINRLFKIFYKYELDLAQPTIYLGKIPHSIIRTRSGYILRYSSFVDMGCPIFKTHLLLETLPIFTLTRSGWGIDYLWSEKHKDKKMALIDAVSLLHKVGIAQDYRGGLDYYARLGKFGIDSWNDLGRIISQYNLSCKEEIRGSIRLSLPLFFL